MLIVLFIRFPYLHGSKNLGMPFIRDAVPEHGIKPITILIYNIYIYYFISHYINKSIYNNITDNYYYNNTIIIDKKKPLIDAFILGIVIYDVYETTTYSIFKN